MNDIFYTEVDRNLQRELDTRGTSGFTGQRLTDNLNFMHGKIANVIMLAYEDGTNTSKIVSTLGGMQVRNGRYVPTSVADILNGNNSNDIGYATHLLYNKETVIFVPTNDNKAQKAMISSSLHFDETGRFGPGITEVTVDIGDHSMGLLNKATVNIIVPNPTRDLDTIEKYWLRPGRYAKIEIHHPDDAIITNQKLTPISLPNQSRIKQLHPNWDTSDYEKGKKMNVFQFEGLITSFTLEYTTSGHVEISLSLTGTSNIYPDISMYLPSTTTGNSVKVTTPNSEKIELETKAVASNTGPGADTSTQLYDFINDRVSEIEKTVDPTQTLNILSRFYITGYDNTQYTDHYVLFGEPFPSTTTTPSTDPATATPPTTNRNRYITLGALVYIINNFILKQKLASNIPFTELICDDSICFSHYLENLISTDPDDIMLLPKQTNSDYDMNTYGTLKYYSNVKNDLSLPWPGIYEKSSSGDGVIYPSRIFINLKVIERQLDVLSKKNTRTFTLKSFMSTISNTIKNSTAEAIDMKLMSLPSDLNKLLFTDTKFVKIKPILEYSVPMFANHPAGTIVREFSLTSKLPSNVQSLAYVLNQGEDVTEEQIAPFVNVMYSSDDAEKLEKNLKAYQDKHEKYITKLRETRIEFGKNPTDTKYITALIKALADHLKYPTNNIKKSQQLMAPIFPFDASFTIDGINGFRYGDVVIFEALPLKYRVNTVFSIIGVKHNVNSSGVWTTEIRCIMRPKIG